MSESKAGRPPKFRSAKVMQAQIDAYFNACKGEPLFDENGKAVLNKWGEAVMVGERPPTVTGLALALGFADRSSLMDYQGKPQFEAIITRAKSRIEMYTEERLFDKDGSAGARFSLRNNFRGWKNETEVTVSAAEDVNIMAEIRSRMEAEGDTSSALRAPSPQGEGNTSSVLRAPSPQGEGFEGAPQ